MSEDSNDTQTNIVSDNSDSTKFNLLFLAVLIDLLGFGIIIPILPFLVKDLNSNQEGLLVALLLSTYSLAQFISSPIWGRLSDKIGRRPVILIGLIGSSISFAYFGIVEEYILLLSSRILAGIFTGATLPTARAYVADITPPKDRARRYGLLGAAFGIGFTFGPAIGSLLSLDIFLVPNFPKQASASFFAAILCMGNFILAYYKLPESLIDKEDDSSPSLSTTKQFKILSKNKMILILFTIFFITTLIFSSFESILPLFANNIDDRINEQNIGYFFAAIGVLIAIIQTTLVGPIVDFFGEDKTIYLALILQTLSFFLISIATSVTLLGITIIPLTLGTALLNPSLTSSLSNKLDKTNQGIGLGLNSSIGSLGRVIGPLYGGLLYDNLSPRSPFSIGSIILLILVITTYNQTFVKQDKS